MHNDRNYTAYTVSVIVRLVWSLTLGLFLFFPLGIIFFVIIDVFFPESDKGYNMLTKMFQWGSCYWFRGIEFKLKQEEYELDVKKVKKFE